MSAVENPRRVVERVGEARLPTVHGVFRIVAYQAADGIEQVALVAGDPGHAEVAPLVRVHSECLTGDVLGSLKCDCGDQLAIAKEWIAAEADQGGAGVVVYLRGHEGRGIGLANKIRAYQLQDQGLDTVDANLSQGLPVDARQYGVAAAILLDLGAPEVRLLTNNPRKAEGLRACGIDVTEMVPLVAGRTAESSSYLDVKRERLGHTLPDAG